MGNRIRADYNPRHYEKSAPQRNGDCCRQNCGRKGPEGWLPKLGAPTLDVCQCIHRHSKSDEWHGRPQRCRKCCYEQACGGPHSEVSACVHSLNPTLARSVGQLVPEPWSVASAPKQAPPR